MSKVNDPANMKEEKVRLTQMVKAAGCAAKIFPGILSEALKDIDWPADDNVLVGFEGRDDAGVYKVNDDLALILTTDFFTPVVDDPFTFGQIAAANALSDVYAMGGTPVTALNIVAFPQTEDIGILREILKGGASKAGESNTVIIGGHSIDIPSIAYGLAVTGYIHPSKIKGNHNARPGDALVLTKALGTGILNNFVKFSELGKEQLDSLLASMLRLNRNASECMIRSNANACTDVTGFGFAGHAMQMAKASGVKFLVEAGSLPVLDGATEGIAANMLTRGDRSNRDYTKDHVSSKGSVNKDLEHLLYDPQTSGGLLISVPAANAESLLHDLRKNGDEVSAIIGKVMMPEDESEKGTIVINYA